MPEACAGFIKPVMKSAEQRKGPLRALRTANSQSLTPLTLMNTLSLQAQHRITIGNCKPNSGISRVGSAGAKALEHNECWNNGALELNFKELLGKAAKCICVQCGTHFVLDSHLTSSCCTRKLNVPATVYKD